MKKLIFLLLLIPCLAIAAADTFEGAAVDTNVMIEGTTGFASLDGTAIKSATVTPDIFDENFETTITAGCTTGTDETSDNCTASAGCTVDPDADPADVSSPTGWESECLKITSDAEDNQNDYIEYSLSQDYSEIYFRMDFVVTSIGLDAEGEYASVATMHDSSYKRAFRVRIQRISGVNYIRLEANHSSSVEGTTVLSVDTLYTVEVHYIQNTSIVWKINGVTQTAPTPGDFAARKPLVGEYASDGANVIYIDRVGIDSDEWIESW